MKVEEEGHLLQRSIDNIAIVLTDKENNKSICVRYGDIRWDTSTPRREIEPVIEEALLSMGPARYSIEYPRKEQKMLTTWEPKYIPPYLDYYPWLAGFNRPFNSVMNGDNWYAVFAVTNLPPTTRPITGWTYSPNINLAGTVTGTLYNIINSQTPTCTCKRIEITAVYFNISNASAASALNVADNGLSFFRVPPPTFVPEKWRLYVRRHNFLQSNAENQDNICEWTTFDELCGLAHKTEYRTMSSAYTPGGMPTTFVDIAGNPNISQTKLVTWSWEFPEGITLKTSDDLVIRVGTQVPAVQVLGQTGVKNITASAYFEKKKIGIDVIYQNSQSSIVIITP